jgi:hypothetical protein
VLFINDIGSAELSPEGKTLLVPLAAADMF